MRLARSLSCAAALTLGACGPEAQPFTSSGATALARCTMTVEGSLAGCSILEASVPGSGDWFLARLRTERFEPALHDGTPVEISMLVRLTFLPEGGEPAP